MKELLNAVQIELSSSQCVLWLTLGGMRGRCQRGILRTIYRRLAPLVMGSPGRNLFLEERLEEGKDIRGDDFVALGGGMGVVPLHHSIHAEDAL